MTATKNQWLVKFVILNITSLIWGGLSDLCNKILFSSEKSFYTISWFAINVPNMLLLLLSIIFISIGCALVTKKYKGLQKVEFGTFIFFSLVSFIYFGPSLFPGSLLIATLAGITIFLFVLNKKNPKRNL